MGVKQQFTLSVMCVTNWRIDTFLTPTLHGMECLWDVLPNFLQGGLRQSLLRDGLVWSLSQPSVHFVSHVLDWQQIGRHHRHSYV